MLVGIRKLEEGNEDKKRPEKMFVRRKKKIG